MDSDEEYGFYSSRGRGRGRGRGHQTYAYSYNEEESQHQWYNQYQSDDEQCHESDGGYNGEGYGYEDRIRAYDQQIAYGGVYDQGERYQSFHEEYTHDHYPPSPQQESSQDDAIIGILSQLLDQQKETNERLDRIIACQKMTDSELIQIALEVEVEGSSDEEGLKSLEDQCMESPLEVLEQGLEEESDEDDSSAVDYTPSFFSTSPPNDELIPHLEEPLEDQHEVPKGLVSHEDLFADACEDLSREPPSQQEFVSLDKSVESWTPKYQNEDVDDRLSAKSWSRVEDPYLFTLPPTKFLSFRPYMDIPIERNSYDPSIPVESNLPKGSKSSFDVHLKLGGRKRKWDIKIS